MTTVAQIEDSIRALPASSFCELLDWMERRHDEVLQEQGYEPPELEAAMLKALDSPRQPINEALYEGIRQRWLDKKHAEANQVALQPC
ncbi:hypothetical protein [Prosthecobacter sp.]|uniref:hypothetical protein n=1 Tax=Prosthecobacter sp. TaxID=1965333 RepID=UPI00248851DD|nr:hypothetical protein [Prosthecobacter sp.]MDI1311257.1 hypothetical protein [Prosthecobacter sp.]